MEKKLRSMIAYSDHDIYAVKHQWESNPRTFGRWLVSDHPTFEDAKKLVNGGITMIEGDHMMTVIMIQRLITLICI